ncbi:hypothetical protein HYPSUDRAFT_70092 [Hypholoma sublateritium FD-334 SS-4]|uniref:Uncharacterized protein n=1 Tax=Hypholoma sublateritium (strain FD-334 SS-4) TaxID=945553 RepID=A0A0D2PDB2_HYPSF|nr:hypothetical protein HYPSUDRAFT_70092 [Hypholoma sublateritium FD-334 SS-4]
MPEKAPEKEPPAPATAGANAAPTEDRPANAYPVVQLDVAALSDAVAARLAASLLGHVLFLKNQVPFPVMQLGRIPSGKAASRALKQRTELLASFDTISSHLDTTFSALSTALARCAGARAGTRVQAHVAILVGPSLGTAKARVIMGIDGLEARIWGAREDSGGKIAGDGQESESDEDEENEVGSSADDSDDRAEEPEVSDDDDDDDDNEEEDDDEDDDAEYGEEEESASSDDSQPANSPPAPGPPPPPYTSHADEQRFLQTADRLLSRTLAAADADGRGISSEMTPTQTHVLLRAPRRFAHPAWIPRQGVSASLDGALREFMDRSGLGLACADGSASSNRSVAARKNNKVEGVWITARDGLHVPVANVEGGAAGQGGEGPTDDKDEMIWWSWDGKFVGFNDW